MTLSQWIKKSSTYDFRQLSFMTKLSRQYLSQVAKTGCSPKIAKRIEAATRILTPSRIVSWRELQEISDD